MAYFGRYFDYDTLTAIVVPPDATDYAPASLATVYCTDEDILLRAPQDYLRLCPASQVLASSTDGVFEADSPWLLSSPTVDFEALGVGANNVVALTAPRATFATPGGVLMATNAASGNAVSLRRPGKALGIGQPPAPTDGVNSVAFSVLTFGPQIDNASYDANQFFGIDPASSDRPPSRLYDRRELQQYTVLTVLRRAYVAAEKTATGDFRLKLEDVTRELDELRARLVVRWGSTRDAEPPTSAFTARIRR